MMEQLMRHTSGGGDVSCFVLRSLCWHFDLERLRLALGEHYGHR